MKVIGAAAVRSTSPREKVNAEMMWLHPHPLPHLRSLSHVVFLCVAGRELTEGGGGVRMGEEPNHTTTR